jgi:hypothetical protein
MDDRVRDPDRHGGDDERKDDDTNRGVAERWHLCVGSIATKFVFSWVRD